MFRICVVALIACRDAASTPAPPRPLETEIARDLTGRLHAPVTVRCTVFPVLCRAELSDGSDLAIRIAPSAGGWDWHADFVDTAPIASYVDGVLSDLGVAQTASCGPRIAHASKITCRLSGGGTAIVSVAKDGQLGLELALDPAAAAARAAPPDDRELTRASRALDDDK